MREQANTGSAWMVVAAAWVGLFLHFGSLLINSFGVFLTTLCEQFNWTRTQVSMAFTLATLTALLAMPVTGWLTDRLGARRPILICTTVFGAGFALLSMLTPRLWHLYALFLLLGLVGPGTSAVPHSSVISRWFSRRRGLALGVAMSGTALGGVVWPSASQYLLQEFGWRTAYALLGGSVLLVAVPLLLLFLRDPAPSRITGGDESKNVADGLTRIEAFRSGIFWVIVISFLIVMASIQACMIHLVPMLTDRGMSPARAALVASLFGVAGMAGRLGTGYLLDLLPAARVPVLAFLMVAIGILLLSFGVTGPAAVLAAMIIGFGYGAEASTIPYLIGRYFGMRSFAEIYSYIFIAVPLGGAFGPVLLSAGYDRSGSYQFALLVFGLLTLAAAGLMTRLSAYPAFEPSTEMPSKPVSAGSV
ncbi:MAG: MFS transporter [Acidobacteriota bacterium]|nr:MAG: MFS transporter [Acidobacteriota bacterium]